MTTMGEEELKCVICGKSSKHWIIYSTYVHGQPDLDTRPNSLARCEMDKYIQRCPYCDYCAPNISEGGLEAKRIIQIDAYQKQLRSPYFPALVNIYLCWSLIQENLDQFADAGWACVEAAWVCDDVGNDKGAKTCRIKALSLLRKAEEAGQSFAEQVGVNDCIIVDLLRRSDQFDLALRVCEEGLKKNPEKVISNILQFQKTLIDKSDTACYAIPKELFEKKRENKSSLRT